MADRKGSMGNTMSEIMSWRLLRKNPSGALVWGIFGVSLVMDGYFYQHFLRKKEYQVEYTKRMWNERVEMLENPVRLKLYYPSNESVPRINQPLLDVYKKMSAEEERMRKRIEECTRLVEAERN